jgi:hypothetical protein
MAKITEGMKEVAAQSKLWAVATATKDGEPNVVPIAFAKVLSDDELLLMDNFMKKTRDNIEANPRVAISVWAPGDSKGYQFKGNARVETSGEVFDEGVKWVKASEPGLNPKAAIIVKVTAIYITSPGPHAGEPVQ